MKRSGAIIALAVCIVFTTPTAVFAQRGGRSQGDTVEVRLASPMPRNSDWGRALDRMAAECARATNNGVRIRVIHDGVEGGEGKMLSSLATDNIQAALFTSFGLAEICPGVLTLSVPFMIRNDAELDLVFRELMPVFDAQVARTNYAVLAWSKAGWVNVFSKDPVFVPDDLRKHRIATGPESGELNTAFKSMGFNLVETEMTDTGTRLASGMISAIYMMPAAVAPLQLHKELSNMLEIPIAPFVGGIVMNRVTWNRLGPDRQREVTRVIRSIAEEFDNAMPKIVEDGMRVMQRDGLRVNRVSPAQEAMWRAELDKAMPPLLGTTFDRDIYQRISGILERARGGR